MISKLGSNPFVRRQQAESEAGEIGKKAPVGKTLRQPEAAPAAGKSVVGTDHFERATGGLFATAFAPPAPGPLHEPAAPGGAGSDFVGGAAEPFDSAALAADTQSSKLQSLTEQLEQLNAEKQELQKAMVELMEQIKKLQSGAPADPRLADLMSGLERLRDQLAAVDEKIANVSSQIEEIGKESQEEVRARENLSKDRRSEAASADKEPMASAPHSRDAVSSGDKEP